MSFNYSDRLSPERPTYDLVLYCLFSRAKRSSSVSFGSTFSAGATSFLGGAARTGGPEFAPELLLGGLGAIPARGFGGGGAAALGFAAYCY